MALSNALAGRIRKLESLPRVLSTKDKWNSIHVAALQSLSDEDQRTCYPTQGGDEHQEFAKDGAATDRYHEAVVDEFTNSGRFTIAELDDVLAEV